LPFLFNDLKKNIQYLLRIGKKHLSLQPIIVNNQVLDFNGGNHCGSACCKTLIVSSEVCCVLCKGQKTTLCVLCMGHLDLIMTTK